MKNVPVSLSGGRGYDVRVGVPLRGLGRALRPLGLGRTVLVASPPPVARRYARPLLVGLRAAGFAPVLAPMPDGEAKKNLRTVQGLYRQFLRARLDRTCAVVALGGGVAGDTAGFAAATYLRGLPFVQCPTTLLAMVDSAIGGKTGVDLPEGKNLVGAFWQPRLVWADLSVLKTLPDREWRTGLAEVVKYGVIADRSILEALEDEDLAGLRRRPALVEKLVARSVQIKAGVVASDERETGGRRALLNLGHTFGHAVETVTGYSAYTHGEAVSLGMCAAARLAVKLKILRGADMERLEALLARWGLPLHARRPLARPAILAAMARDKKAVAGRLRFVVPTALGRAKVVKDVSPEILDEVLMEVGL